MVLSTVRRSGNSIVVSIPREALEEAGVAIGDMVSVTIRPVDIRPRLTPALNATAERIVANPQTAVAFERLADA